MDDGGAVPPIERRCKRCGKKMSTSKRPVAEPSPASSSVRTVPLKLRNLGFGSSRHCRTKRGRTVGVLRMKGIARGEIEGDDYLTDHAPRDREPVGDFDRREVLGSRHFRGDRAFEKAQSRRYRNGEI